MYSDFSVYTSLQSLNTIPRKMYAKIDKLPSGRFWENELLFFFKLKFIFLNWKFYKNEKKQGDHRESRMKFPVFSLMKKCIVPHLRGREAFEYHSWGLGGAVSPPGQILKMGPLRVILRHFKAIQSYIYKVISKVIFL